MRKMILQQLYSWYVQKTAPENTKYSRNETILKIGHLATALAHAKAKAFADLVIVGQKLKMQKPWEKQFFNNIVTVLYKKPLRKTPNIREMRPFSKSPILKGLSPYEGIAFAKLVIFGQKLKMQKTWEKRFYNNIIVGLCKKALQKIPNIREMGPFSKSATLQRL